MISTYQEYREMRDTLSTDEMAALLQEISEEIGNDEEAQDIWRELVGQANKYLKIRSEWYLMSREQRMDRDASRTASHNSLIVKFNMLARFLKMQGKTAAWREKLGDPETDPYSRKKIGDFGCYIVFVNSICAR